MKKDPRLTKRLIAGLCQEDKLFKAQAFIRFYNLFGSKAVANEEKVKFLKYFFIPLGKL